MVDKHSMTIDLDDGSFSAYFLMKIRLVRLIVPPRRIPPTIAMTVVSPR